MFGPTLSGFTMLVQYLMRTLAAARPAISAAEHLSSSDHTFSLQPGIHLGSPDTLQAFGIDLILVNKIFALIN